MEYISVKEASKRWNVSERTVRNYCANNKIDGAYITGKTWNIPENATKPKSCIDRETKLDSSECAPRERSVSTVLLTLRFS